MLPTLKGRLVEGGLAACVLAVPAVVLSGTAASADPGNGMGACRRRSNTERVTPVEFCAIHQVV